jgi:hypothetical protein
VVVIENAGKYKRWKHILYGGAPDERHKRILDRCKDVYHYDRKTLIALALVLWRELKVSEIQNFVEGEFAQEFAESRERAWSNSLFEGRGSAIA